MKQCISILASTIFLCLGAYSDDHFQLALTRPPNALSLAATGPSIERFIPPDPVLSCQPPRVAGHNMDFRRMTMAEVMCMLTQLPDRRPGSENARRAEVFLDSAFRALGCTVTRQEVPVNDWHCSETRLLVDSESIRCSAVPFSAFADEIKGRLVYVAEEQDLWRAGVKDAIVVSPQHYPLQPVDALWDSRLPGTTAIPPRNA